MAGWEGKGRKRTIEQLSSVGLSSLKLDGDDVTEGLVQKLGGNTLLRSRREDNGGGGRDEGKRSGLNGKGRARINGRG